MPTIGFLHTSVVHVPTFELLVLAQATAARSIFVVEERLLESARRSGPGDPAVSRRVERAVDGLRRRGADVVVCTCSTIGGVAEEVGRAIDVPVVRVDRPMAEMAVDHGGRVVVVAALESALAPTRRLLESVAAERGVELDVETAIVADAWGRFEAGDREGYPELIGEALLALAARADVIVLAQASMADAAERPDVRVPVLSSPAMAVAAVLG